MENFLIFSIVLFLIIHSICCEWISFKSYFESGTQEANIIRARNNCGKGYVQLLGDCRPTY